MGTEPSKWYDPEFRRNYQRELYKKQRAGILDERRKQRDARKAWFQELRQNQACQRCHSPRMGIHWHYIERAKDSPFTEQNLAEVMHMVRNGYKEETILTKLRSELVAICSKCQEETRTEYMEALGRTRRQDYEREYYAGNRGKLRKQREERRALRQDWLDEQMHQPCSVCQSWVGVEWHHTNPAVDHPQERYNVMMVTQLVRGCAAMIHIQAAFAALYPICRTCYEQKLHSGSG